MLGMIAVTAEWSSNMGDFATSAVQRISGRRRYKLYQYALQDASSMMAARVGQRRQYGYHIISTPPTETAMIGFRVK